MTVRSMLIVAVLLMAGREAAAQSGSRGFFGSGSRGYSAPSQGYAAPAQGYSAPPQGTYGGGYSGGCCAAPSYQAGNGCSSHGVTRVHGGCGSNNVVYSAPAGCCSTSAGYHDSSVRRQRYSTNTYSNYGGPAHSSPQYSSAPIAIRQETIQVPAPIQSSPPMPNP